MIGAGLHRPRSAGSGAPFELRFVDLLLLIIATLMVLAVVLSITSSLVGSGRPAGHTGRPRIVTGRVPVALAGQPYDLVLAAAGGDGSYSWERLGGRLPVGLTLLPSGHIRGVPRSPGRFTTIVALTDGQGRSGGQTQLLFTVEARPPRPTRSSNPLRIRSEKLRAETAIHDQPYNYQLHAEAGLPPYAWKLPKDTQLPPGLRLTAGGALSGIPEEIGEMEFDVLVKDHGGNSAVQTVSMNVIDPPWRRVLNWIASSAVLTVLLNLLLRWRQVRAWLSDQYLRVVLGRPQRY